ncbi:hypothetical protein GA0115261_114571, partial [Streptomyces sp. OspMP-M43]
AGPDRRISSRSGPAALSGFPGRRPAATASGQWAWAPCGVAGVMPSVVAYRDRTSLPIAG